MRYDTPVLFVREGQRTYNPDTGNYDVGAPVTRLEFGSVMDTRASFAQLIYGRIKQGSLTVQLQNHMNDVFDYIRINDIAYKVDYERRLRIKHVFIVSEVP